MENLYCYEQKLQSYLDEYHCILNQMINKMTSVELKLYKILLLTL